MKRYTFIFQSYTQIKIDEKVVDVYEGVINKEFEELRVTVYGENYASAEIKAKNEVNEIINKLYESHRTPKDYIHLKLKSVEDLEH